MKVLIAKSTRKQVQVESFPKPLKGGEGEVMLVNGRRDLVAKVYHPGKSPPLDKLQTMLASPPIQPSNHLAVAWPVEILFDQTGSFAGYLMPKVEAAHKIFSFYNTATRLTLCHAFDYRYLVRTARNLAVAMDSVHRVGHVIGDFNESNVLVSLKALVTLVDTDSFQITNPRSGATYRCLVGKGEFLPPELLGKSFSATSRTDNHDLFALGVLVFKLLFGGFHPFDGRYKGHEDPPPSIEKQIRAGHFPHGKMKGPYEPDRTAVPLATISVELTELMMRCFEAGHKDPSARPRAHEWIDSLDKFEQSLVSCGRSRHHYFGRHIGGNCPWCYRAQLGLGDPFEDPTRRSTFQQQPLPAPTIATVAQTVTMPRPARATAQPATVPQPHQPMANWTPKSVAHLQKRLSQGAWWTLLLFLILGFAVPPWRPWIESGFIVVGFLVFALVQSSRRLYGVASAACCLLLIATARPPDLSGSTLSPAYGASSSAQQDLNSAASVQKDIQEIKAELAKERQKASERKGAGAKTRNHLARHSLNYQLKSKSQADNYRPIVKRDSPRAARKASAPAPDLGLGKSIGAPGGTGSDGGSNENSGLLGGSQVGDGSH